MKELSQLIAKLEEAVGEGGDARETMGHDEAVERAVSVQAKYDVLAQKHTFTPGQMVQWKPGACNRKFPMYGEPVVVVEILATPLPAKEDTGSPYIADELDAKVGMIRGGEYLEYLLCSRRLMPWGQ